MKKLSKKNIKKLGVAVGAISGAIAPISTSVSFSIKPTTQQTNLDAFLKDFNETKNIKPMNDELRKKVVADNFYKGNLNSLQITNVTSTSYWRITDEHKLEAIFKELVDLDPAKYTIDEKKSIAQSILEASGYSDFIVNIGFDPNAKVTESDIAATWGPETSLIDKTAQISTTQSKTGFQSNYHQGKSDQGNDRVYAISNQDILIYYESIAFLSTKFTNLYKVVDAFLNGNDNANDTLIGLITNWNKAIDAFYTFITSSKINTDWIKTLPDFKYIQKINGTPSTEDEAYKLILNSKIISRTYNSDAIAEHRTRYENASPKSKIAKQTSLIDELSITLQSYVQAALEHFNKPELKDSIISQYTRDDKGAPITIGGPKDILKGDELESTISLAKELVSHSNHFTLDVELRINDNPFTGYGLEIRGGHNNNTHFESVDHLGIKMPFIKYKDEKTLEQTYEYAKSSNLNRLIDIKWFSKTDSYTLPELTADSKKIMASDYSIYYAIKLEINGQKLEPMLIVYENDHDNDSSLKNIDEHRYEGLLEDIHTVAGGLADVIASLADIHTPIPAIPGLYRVVGGGILIWQVGPSGTKIVLTQDSHSPSVYLDFWRDGKAAAPKEDEYTGFTELARELSDLFEREWKNWVNTTKNSGHFDPSSTYVPTLTLNTITFPELRFNTYDDYGWDDTHSDNFRFANGIINYTFKVAEHTN